MKLNRRMMLALLLLMSLFINANVTEAATPDFETLTPNEYERKEFKENTEYLHEKALYENKQSIPEQQKELTFELPTSNSNEEILNQLFVGEINAQHTIAEKAEQMNLFSDKKPEDLRLKDKSEHSPNRQIQLMIIIGLLAIGLMVMLVLLIPKMVQGNQQLK